MTAISRDAAQRLSAAPMHKERNSKMGNPGFAAHSSAATPAASGPPISATRVPMRSSKMPAPMVPKNLPKAVAVTICAATPAETPSSRPSIGIVGMIIVQAPERKVPA